MANYNSRWGARPVERKVGGAEMRSRPGPVVVTRKGAWWHRHSRKAGLIFLFLKYSFPDIFRLENIQWRRKDKEKDNQYGESHTLTSLELDEDFSLKPYHHLIWQRYNFQFFPNINILWYFSSLTLHILGRIYIYIRVLEIWEYKIEIDVYSDMINLNTIYPIKIARRWIGKKNTCKV